MDTLQFLFSTIIFVMVFIWLIPIFIDNVINIFNFLRNKRHFNKTGFICRIFGHKWNKKRKDNQYCKRWSCEKFRTKVYSYSKKMKNQYIGKSIKNN